MIWMFCHKQDYLKIAKIQYKSLKIVYNSNESYEELLYVTTKCQFIKSGCVYWLLMFLKA